MKHQPTNRIIYNRAQTMRKEMSPAESKLWQHLRSERLNGLRFRKQHPVEDYILDFYCPSANLAVEVDGETHLDRAEYDAKRTTWLQALGYRVIRFTNVEVFENINGVLEAILRECQRKL